MIALQSCVLILGLIASVYSLTCYECDSSKGDATCHENESKSYWKTSTCSRRIDQLKLDIHPRAVRCVHVTYVEDNVEQINRKCGFEGICALLEGLNDIKILGNVSDIQCHTCNTDYCNIVGNPRQIVYRINNHL